MLTETDSVRPGDLRTSARHQIYFAFTGFALHFIRFMDIDGKDLLIDCAHTMRTRYL